MGRNRFCCMGCLLGVLDKPETLDTALTELDTIVFIPLSLLAVIDPVRRFGVVEYFDMY